jgi:precorrin-2 dehydrogenase/sirohydrochlorin ferrochelatase
MNEARPWPADARYRALPIAQVTTCRRLLIAGGGFETEARVRHALRFDWLSISLVVRFAGPALLDLRRRDLRLALHERDVLEGDVAYADVVFEDTGDRATAEQVAAWCETHRRPLNACDKPELCDLYYMSLVPLGPLVLGISSGGDAPAVSAALRRWLEASLSPGWAMAAHVMGELRRSLPSGHARIDVLKAIARDETFLDLVVRNDEAGLRDLIQHAVRRMPA